MESPDRSQTTEPAARTETTSPPAGTGSSAATVVRAVVALAAVLAFTFVLYRQSAVTGLSMKTGPRSAMSWKLVDLEGNPVDLAQFQGRPVFLNVWATWCPPCVAEFPSIAQMANDPRVKEAGVEVICISVDDSLAPVQQFVKSRPLVKDGPTILVANDYPPDEFQTQGIPATFLIGPDGTIQASIIGSEDWTRSALVDQIVALGDLPKSSKPGS